MCSCVLSMIWFHVFTLSFSSTGVYLFAFNLRCFKILDLVLPAKLPSF